MVSRRRRAFAKLAPADWIPQPGDRVFLPAESGQVGRVCAEGTVVSCGAVDPEIVTVRCVMCGRVVVRQFWSQSLRPVVSRLRK